MDTSKRILMIVPLCLLAPGVQASEKHGNWQKTFWQYCGNSQVDIIPYGCPEACFEGDWRHVQRDPHGIDYYESLSGYSDYCNRLAAKTLENIKGLLCRVGYATVIILGIEHSPTCAVNYMYTHRGMKKRPGILIEKLKDYTDSTDITIHYVGINRKYPMKALNELTFFLTQTQMMERSEKGDNNL